MLFEVDPSDPNSGRAVHWVRWTVRVGLALAGAVCLVIEAVVPSALWLGGGSCLPPPGDRGCGSTLVAGIFLLPGLGLIARGIALIG